MEFISLKQQSLVPESNINAFKLVTDSRNDVEINKYSNSTIKVNLYQIR
jgi:hypothetical protein